MFAHNQWCIVSTTMKQAFKTHAVVDSDHSRTISDEKSIFGRPIWSARNLGSLLRFIMSICFWATFHRLHQFVQKLLDVFNHEKVGGVHLKDLEVNGHWHDRLCASKSFGWQLKLRSWPLFLSEISVSEICSISSLAGSGKQAPKLQECISGFEFQLFRN